MGWNCCEMVVARSEELLTRVWHLSDSLQVSRAVTPHLSTIFHEHSGNIVIQNGVC